MSASPEIPSESVEVRERLTSGEQVEVRRLVEAATDHDAVAPLSEHVLLQLRGPVHREPDASPGERHVLVRTPAGELAGYAQLGVPAPDALTAAELVVDPARRGLGFGKELLRALVARAPGGDLAVWAHGRRPAAERLAASAGLHEGRVLWQVRRPLGPDLPAPSWPADITPRVFVPGQDEERWLDCNRRAFANHPDQGSWTRDDLEVREAEGWFDPSGFFLAERAGERRLAGFHWTKVHPGRGGSAPIGEVYVIGVDPDEQGTGLGRALLLHGLAHLRGKGLTDVMLYVDDDNVPALALYERMGFVRDHADVMFRTPAR